MFVIAFAPGPVSAGTAEGECMVSRYNTTKPASVANLNCTSNDVALAIYEVENGPDSCVLGEQVEGVVLKGIFIATSNERWDVGVFISQDGGTPNALGGICYSDFLNPVSADNSDLDLLGGAGPYYNGEILEDPADACGDIQQGEAGESDYMTDPISFICQDNDMDGQADIASCTVWANSRSDGTANKPSCADESDVTAETSAKCTCDFVNITNLRVDYDAQIEVIKSLPYAGDPGTFDLLIDGVTEAAGVGDLGTTGAVTVSAGDSETPGDTHTVSESAAGGTNPGAYSTSISCVDRGQTTFDDLGTALTTMGTSIDVPVDPSDDIVCTITNTNGCASASCDSNDTVCADFTCDPTQDINSQCVPTFAGSGQLCRAGSGDLCDPDEYCVEGQVECPGDVISTTQTLCRAGSGDVCDPDEYCTGVAGEACPTDSYQGSTHVCNAGSGDACDPDELCPGTPGGSCPTDTFEPASTVCRTGSGDVCDPDEFCPGVADAACPQDAFEPSTTVCNAGSGDLCDPDETCTGVAGEACPTDTVADPGTVCNAGSGDLCDPDEVCSGNADEACPTDTYASAGTLCRQGSGDACDPDEVCSGNPDEACPDDVVTAAGTVCNPGSGDLCDPDEVCSGNAGEACPTDAYAAAGTVCNPGSGDLCDPDEVCTGNPDQACPGDSFEPSTTVCNASGGACDPAEYCPGTADGSCPSDALSPAGTICRASGSGDLICDPPEVCDGSSAECPAVDVIADEGTACGNPADTACTDPDTCDGTGYCQNNNEACGWATDSALCKYDMAPTKGTCFGGAMDGGACFIDDECVAGGGLCIDGFCAGGDADGIACTVPDTDPCGDGGGACVNGLCQGGAYDGTVCCYAEGGSCEQTDQFRLLYSPDVQNFPSYTLGASNPGQTFYNLIYDASEIGEEDFTVTVSIPYPYVTVGGMPLHIYDGEDVALDDMCLMPGDGIRSEPVFITLDDWIGGNPAGGPWNLVCDQVTDPVAGGYCDFDITVLNEEIPESGLVFINIHLDYGLKGKFVDANPPGDPFGQGFPEDRYDRHPFISAWSSSHALFNTGDGSGDVGVADCTAYYFAHTDAPDAGTCDGGADDGQACTVGGAPCADGATCVANGPLYGDELENLNLFQQIRGMFGRLSCSDSGEGFETYQLRLVHPEDGAVANTETDEDGFWYFDYRHKGKPTTYTVEVSPDGDFDGNTVASTTVEMQGNGWWNVNFTATGCAGEPVWASEVIYGSGRNKTNNLSFNTADPALD